MKRSGVVYIILLIFLAGCGDDGRDLENYGDLDSSPGGIMLVDSSEHMGGYGRTECLVCHNVSLNVHRRPERPSYIDPDALNEATKKEGEEVFCTTCHGQNK